MENKVGQFIFMAYSSINAGVHLISNLITADIAKASNNSEAEAKFRRKLLKMITPSVDPESWKNVETLIGIKLTQDTLCYAKITKEMVRSSITMHWIL